MTTGGVRERYRRVLGQYPTGVAIITGRRQDGSPSGMTVGTFSSVSLDPPLVAFMVDRSSSTWPTLASSGSFAVNVLAFDQESLCRQFSSKGQDRFAGVSWSERSTKSPVIDGVAAWVDCTVRDVVEAGDHFIVIGAVLDLDVGTASLPLLFHRGGYGQFTPLTAVAADRDLMTHMRDADLARDEMFDLARDLGVECIASSIVDGELALLASANGAAERALPLSRLGQRLPFTAPLGALFVAWDTEASQNYWMRNATDDVSDLALLSDMLRQVRERGYIVGHGRPSHTAVDELLRDAQSQRPEGPAPHVLPKTVASMIRRYDSAGDLDRHLEDVATIAAPVFDSTGRVVLQLTLFNLPASLTVSDLERYVAALKDAADRVTARKRSEVRACQEGNAS